MTDFDPAFDSAAGTGDTDTEQTCGRAGRGPSILLLLSAIVALAVSCWALVGPFSVEFLTSLDMGWVLVGGAIVIGAVLVLLPARRSRN
ncbi:MAG: hypothetical protein GXY65_06350 [Rhodococcus sp.]|uniref:hypothetical protein n=1 Tax=Rhodococcus TaxID=1827 RepID=UPI0016A73334|nr:MULTISPECIES: hypothetical protein [Rhodococcus]NLV78956.1 hypothetical protein [Rhodococcus sp. (in: high G+C Gram-positive bacteria)]